MLKEAIEFLFNQGRNSTRHEVVEIDARRWMRVGPNCVEDISAPVPVHRHNVYTLRSLIAAMAPWATPAACVFIGRERVEVLLDRGDAIDRLCLCLHFSEMYRQLDAIEQYREQSQIILHLRRYYLLHNPELKNVIAKIDTLRWNRNTETFSEVKAETKALGRSINASVTGADQLPEHFTLVLPVLADENLADPCKVTCQIIPHVDDEQLEIKLEPDAKLHLMDTALNNLRRRIVGELEPLGINVPVLLGAV